MKGERGSVFSRGSFRHYLSLTVYPFKKRRCCYEANNIIIVGNEEYLAKYHQYFGELTESFFTSGECAAEIERVYDMIRPYVENDPTAFYTVSEFDEAVETLKQFCSLRSESVVKQLSGELGSTSDTQKDEDKVDASSVTISKMGTQGGEKGAQAPNPGDNKQSTQPSSVQ